MYMNEHVINTFSSITNDRLIKIIIRNRTRIDRLSLIRESTLRISYAT